MDRRRWRHLDGLSVEGRLVVSVATESGGHIGDGGAAAAAEGASELGAARAGERAATGRNEQLGLRCCLVHVDETRPAAAAATSRPQHRQVEEELSAYRTRTVSAEEAQLRC